MSNRKNIIFDMDGVLWRSTTPLANLQEVFDTLSSLGYQYILATNNSTKTVAAYQQKLSGFGVNISADKIITSSIASAELLKEILPDRGGVFPLGEDGLTDALESAGFHFDDKQPQAVVAGLDHHLDYKKLETAAHLIRSGVMFIGTNPDRTFPTNFGLGPGAGSILAAIEAATDIKPIIAGKPKPFMFQLAMNRMQSTPATTIMVGDRLDTDILGASQLGLITVLLYSGVSSKQEMENSSIKPDMSFEDISAFIRYLQQNE